VHGQGEQAHLQTEVKHTLGRGEEVPKKTDSFWWFLEHNFWSSKRYLGKETSQDKRDRLFQKFVSRREIMINVWEYIECIIIGLYAVFYKSLASHDGALCL